MLNNTKRPLLADETGATAVEYGLILGLLAVGLISAVVSLSNEVSDDFQTVETHYRAANSS